MTAPAHAPRAGYRQALLSGHHGGTMFGGNDPENTIFNPKRKRGLGPTAA